MYNSSTLIKASIRSADFGNLADTLDRLKLGKIDGIHFDVMNGSFGPLDFAMGPSFVSQLRKHSDLPFEVHLWIKDPHYYLKSFAESGADTIIIHIEASDDPRTDLLEIKRLGCIPGIAINPNTNPELLTTLLSHCEIINVMTIDPLLPGQLSKQGLHNLSKISDLSKTSSEDILVQADGAVSLDTKDKFLLSGATSMVAGYPIFSQDNFHEAVRALRNH